MYPRLLRLFCCVAILMNVAHAHAAIKADSLLKVLKTTTTDTGKVKLKLAIAELYKNNDLVKSLGYANDALELSAQIGWKEGEMMSEYAIADCYPVINVFSESLEHLQNCLKIAESIGRKDYQLKALKGIAEAYNSLDSFGKTMEYKRLTIAKARQVRDTTEETQQLNFMGGAFADRKIYDSAIYYWKMCIDHAIRENDLPVVAMAFNNFSEAYSRRGLNDTAKLILADALQRLGNEETKRARYAESFIKLNLSHVYKEDGMIDSAVIMGEAGLALARNIPVPETILGGLKLLSEIYEKRGDKEKALGYYKEYVVLKDSFEKHSKIMDDQRKVLMFDLSKSVDYFNREKAASDKVRGAQRAIITMTICGIAILLLLGGFTYRNLLQKRKQNKVITGQKEMLELQNEKIEASLLQKEILLKEVHHRVKNNLQVVSSLLDLQSYSIEDKATRSILKESQNRVYTMSVIHQRLYQDEKFDRVAFSGFAQDLFEHINDLVSHTVPVKFNNNIPDIYPDIDTAVPLGLILNELITNSFKYAIPNNPKPEITVNIEQLEDHCVLTYSDNGPGLPEHVSLSNTNTLGLKLIRRLSKQIKGNVTYSREEWSTFEIAFVSDIIILANE